MNDKSKGIIIDIILEFVLGIALFCFLYFGYELLHYPTIIASLIIFLSIPFFWGNIILSIMGKNSIGQRLIRRKK